MATSATINASRLSSAMQKTFISERVFSQEVPTDVVIEVGEAKFPLHKFIMVAKSGYIRRKILEPEQSDLSRIDLSGMPGGAEAFEKAAKFCYGVNFEISVYNVAALRCAAEYLEMTERHCDGNLAVRTEEFLCQAALRTLPSAVIVMRSCEALLPFADELQIVQRCVDAISRKACNEANFPTRSPPEWWASELAGLAPSSLYKVLAAMTARGASPKIISTAICAYAEKTLPDLLTLSGSDGGPSPDRAGGDPRSQQRNLLESIVAILPADRDAALPVGFLCRLLRAAIFLDASVGIRMKLEHRISASLDQASLTDLLTVTLDYTGDQIPDLDSARRIVAEFSEQQMGAAGSFLYGGGESRDCGSTVVQKVARIVDAFVAEIATVEELTVSKFAGVAGTLPKSARRFDDDLYRAVDIYLKAHPGLDEIQREKVCSVVDPLKLSYEARLHASQNKRLPLQIVLHALYYDQLKLRSGGSGAADEPAAAARSGARVDASLMKENEVLRSELTRMNLYVSDLQRSQLGSGSKGGKKAKSFLSSVSKKLGKLNPFRHGSKDTSNMDDENAVDVTKPRRRRFSIG